MPLPCVTFNDSRWKTEKYDLLAQSIFLFVRHTIKKHDTSEKGFASVWWTT